MDTNINPKEKVTDETTGIVNNIYFVDFTITFEPFDTIPASFDFKEGDMEGAFIIRDITL